MQLAAQFTGTHHIGWLNSLRQKTYVWISNSVAVCCRALQSVAERCRVLQCVAVYRSHHLGRLNSIHKNPVIHLNFQQRCSVLQSAAERCRALQCVAVYRSHHRGQLNSLRKNSVINFELPTSLQCVAVRCRVLWSVAVCCSVSFTSPWPAE